MEFFFALVPVLMFGFWIGFLDYFSSELSPAAIVCAAVLFALLACAPALLSRRRGGSCLLRRLSPCRWGALPFSRAAGLLLLLFLIPRIAWWILTAPEMISDYQLYVSQGRHVAETGRLRMEPYLVAIAPNITVFSTLLGGLFTLFGAPELTARVFVLLLHAGCVLLLFGVGRRLLSSRRAFAAAAAFALLPENVFYSLLPGIEALSLFTLLLGLLLLLLLPGRRFPVQLALAVSGGLSLAFSASVRPNAWAAVCAALLWLALKRRAFSARRLAALLGALAAGLVFCLLGHQAFQHSVFTEDKPAGGLGWPLYEGLDLESGGRWTQEKSAYCISVIESHSAKEADRLFLSGALERFRGYTFFEKVRMFLRKGGALWYENNYSTVGVGAPDSDFVQTANRAAGISWTAALLLWISLMLFRLKRRLPDDRRAGCALCLTVILLTALWHEFGTSINRYHYMLIPFVLLMTAHLFPSVPVRTAGSDRSDPAS